MTVRSACTSLVEGESHWQFGHAARFIADDLSDGNIRYFEYENDKFEYLSEYKSGDPQRGIAFMPKRGVNMHENEVVRAYKTVNDTYVEPISFIVPRRSEMFQDDIYPPTIGLKPAMGPSEWFAGKEAIPPKISLASLYDGAGLKEVTGVQDAPTSTMGAPAPKPAEPERKPEPVKKAAEPAPAATPTYRAPPPSMKDQGASMAAMVNKFADDEEKEADDSSSFEEVSKPVERPSATASPTKERVVESKPVPSASQVSDTYFRSSKDLRLTLYQPAPTSASSTPTATLASPASTTSIPTDAVQREMQAIRELIAEQTKTIASQAEQVHNLTNEIESLKAKLG